MFDWFSSYLCFIDISGLLSGAQSLSNIKKHDTIGQGT